MFTLRCTRRLLARAKPALEAAPRAPTTALGDWYANLLHIGRLQLVLAVSERTFLPAIVPAAPMASLAPRLRDRVAEVLDGVGVAALQIGRETAEMESVVFGKTASRQVNGILVDFGRLLEVYVDDDLSLVALSLKLAGTPCSPLFETVRPDATTRALFAPS